MQKRQLRETSCVLLTPFQCYWSVRELWGRGLAGCAFAAQKIKYKKMTEEEEAAPGHILGGPFCTRRPTRVRRARRRAGACLCERPLRSDDWTLHAQSAQGYQGPAYERNILFFAPASLGARYSRSAHRCDPFVISRRLSSQGANVHRLRSEHQVLSVRASARFFGAPRRAPARCGSSFIVLLVASWPPAPPLRAHANDFQRVRALPILLRERAADGGVTAEASKILKLLPPRCRLPSATRPTSGSVAMNEVCEATWGASSVPDTSWNLTFVHS